MIEELSKLTDQQLLEEAKKMKSSSIMHAFFIGAIIGVFIYGFLKNNFGLFALIPLYLIFKAFNKPKDRERNEAIERLLIERKLK